MVAVCGGVSIFNLPGVGLPVLWRWLPQPHNRVNARGGQERGVGMALERKYLTLNSFVSSPHTYLEAIDNTLVSNQNADNVSGAAIPDKELAVVGAGHDELAVAAQEVGLLDVRRRVASSKISGSG